MRCSINGMCMQRIIKSLLFFGIAMLALYAIPWIMILFWSSPICDAGYSDCVIFGMDISPSRRTTYATAWYTVILAPIGVVGAIMALGCWLWLEVIKDRNRS